MKKTLFAAGMIVIIVLGACAIKNVEQRSKNDARKIMIVTTVFPLYDFVKNVGEDKVEASLLLPPGAEAHSFEPRPSDFMKINKADLFVYIGKFMEPWAEDIIKGINKDKVKIVDTSRGIELMKEEKGGVDPHVWLDLGNAKIMVDNIAKALMDKYPANGSFYQNNANNYKEKLTKLDNIYKLSLANCQKREIIYGGHYAFGYLARKYGLKYIAAQGFFPDAEPTAKELIALIEQTKKNNIKYVFYEELSSPKIAETLAGETNSKMLLLNAGHNILKEDFDNKISFISIMETNLKNLEEGLECRKATEK